MATILRGFTANADSRKTRDSLAEATRMAEDAQRCLEQAQAEADRVLSEAREEAARIRAEAFDEGRRAGRADVEQEVRSELGRQWADAPRAFHHLLDEFAQTQREWTARWERDAVQLAIAIAARIVRRESISQPQFAIGLVRESLELASGRRHIRLQLHPDDIALLGEEIRQVLASRGHREPVDVQADPSIERGSCRVLTEHGEIDQRWSTQLARIAEELDA